MQVMHPPVAEASIAFDFPTSVIVVLATLLLGSIAIVAFIDWRRTREKKRLEDLRDAGGSQD